MKLARTSAALPTLGVGGGRRLFDLRGDFG